MITVQIGSNVYCGTGEKLVLIAGPCVIEDERKTLDLAHMISEITRSFPVQFVFKASFDKANRTSLSSYRGPGWKAGLKILKKVRSTVGCPVVTDIHEPWQADKVHAYGIDMIQIPAMLSRQTDLLIAAAETNLPVMVKKGQFMSPSDIGFVASKLANAGCKDILLCERGTCFGYGRLVNDMTNLVVMKRLGYPVVFDATHSVQYRSPSLAETGGTNIIIEPLSRAAVAVGIDALFVEVHPNPTESPSDSHSILPLNRLQGLLEQVVRIRGD